MSKLPAIDEGFNERRLYPRVYLSGLSAEVNSLGADEKYYGFDCLDISESGVKIRCAADRALPFGGSSLLEVHLGVPAESEQISFLTKIQREQQKSADKLLALRIVQIGVRDKELLRRMVQTNVNDLPPN